MRLDGRGVPQATLPPVAAARVAEDVPALEMGSLLSPTERYVVTEPLASGGMGDLYRGRRIGPAGFSKDVVLKQLRRDFASDPRISELFLQEARLSAQLEHPNIVSTLDLIRSTDGLCLVMEYVRGADLRVLLRKARRRGRRLSIASALFVAQELLAALDYLHHKTDERGAALGLLHRDVSPANVLISGAGAVKLTDFGIAGLVRARGDLLPPSRGGAHDRSAVDGGRWRGAGLAAVEDLGAPRRLSLAPGRDLPKASGQIEDPSGVGRNPLRVRGKIGYMSPEQARGEEIDARSDLFSAAVVLYEALVGERLFIGAGDGAQQSPAQVYSTPVPAVSRRRAEVPAELDRVLSKALALNPESRFAEAAALREALREVAWRHKLALGAQELCADLRDVCGADPEEWRREEERTGTASIGAADLNDDVDPFEDPDSARMSLRRGTANGEASDSFSRARAPVEGAVEGDATIPIERLSLGAEPTPPLLAALAMPPEAGDAPKGPLRPTLTEPLPREAVEALGIAAMARQMVPPATPREARSSRGSPGLRDLRTDETAAMPVRPTPVETRQMPLPAAAVLTVIDNRGAAALGEGAEPVPHSIPLSRKNLVLLLALIVFLLGVGVAVGMVLSSPGALHGQELPALYGYGARAAVS